MIIKINKNNCKNLIYFQMILMLSMYFGISVFKIPSIITYLTDVVNIMLLFFWTELKSTSLNKVKGKGIKYSIILFVISIILGCVLNLVSPMLILWGARNLLRGFIFIVACINFLEKDDIPKIFGIFLVAQIINFFMCMYQYFILNLEQDYLGGIFGDTQGCNGATNVFFVIILTYTVIAYLYKKTSFWIMLLVAFSTLIVAALAEMKFYYVEFILVIVLAIMFTKPSLRKFLIIGIAIVGIILAANILKDVFPEQYETLVNIDKLIEYDDSRSGGYNISRINAFEDIDKLFFKDNIFHKLLGYGLGNCEMSSFDFLVSDFYKRYGDYNYRWFAHEMIYLQNGIIGIILFVNIFVQIFIHALWNKKKIIDNKEAQCNATIVQVFSILIVINIWYNQTITTEFQYLIYFVLSIFMVNLKSIYQNSDNQNKVIIEMK